MSLSTVNPFGLRGRIVTMNPARDVLEGGTVFIQDGRIEGILKAGQPVPAQFQKALVLESGGTIFPGLIELHNHLSYNILPLWQVPQAYGNRDEWANAPEYDYLVSKPMDVLGVAAGLPPAIVRYVEVKCLLGGVTTSQGIRLKSSPAIPRYYRGVVRNVETPDDPELLPSRTQITDVEASQWDKFLAALKACNCLLLHLSEGVNEKARQHFQALERNGEWAITDSLTGIHCTALTADDFKVMAEKQASMVWSPLSNLLLYRGTTAVNAARDAGVKIGLGSDWSPSGSKNLLAELKVARAYCDWKGILFSDADLVAMVTCDAAAIIKWQAGLGSIEEKKLADLTVLLAQGGDPYSALLKARESDVALVVIGGAPRYGLPDFVKQLGAGPEAEPISLAQKERLLYLAQDNVDPIMKGLTLAQAKAVLEGALGDLHKTLKQFSAPAPAGFAAARAPGPEAWTLALDELHRTGFELRPRLPSGPAGAATGFDAAPTAARPPNESEIPARIQLDPLALEDDPNFVSILEQQVNLKGELEPFRKALLEALGG